MSDVMLQGEHIRKVFGNTVALDDVTAQVRAGECLAVIGGSGSGKSTLTRILLGLETPTSGEVTYKHLPVQRKSEGLTLLRRESGLVYQNPFASLDPRWRIGRSIAEPLVLRKQDDVETKVREAMLTVGLNPDEFANRYPIDLSGGQAQKAAIARAIVAKPSLLLADEPMSAIDVATRVQILDAFASIRHSNPEMAIVMVSHDLGVVQHIADCIIVMNAGRIVEEGEAGELLARQQTDYTRQLVEAASL